MDDLKGRVAGRPAASLAAAAGQIRAQAGGVNLLCANAGVLAHVAPLAQHTVADWEYTSAGG